MNLVLFLLIACKEEVEPNGVWNVKVSSAGTCDDDSFNYEEACLEAGSTWNVDEDSCIQKLDDASPDTPTYSQEHTFSLFTVYMDGCSDNMSIDEESCKKQKKADGTKHDWEPQPTNLFNMEVDNVFFATGRTTGCTKNYDSVIYYDEAEFGNDNIGGFRWTIEGTAETEQAAGGCSTVPEGLDWIGNEILTVVYSENPNIDEGFQCTMQTTGVFVP